ncbi:hypothetical protein NET02_04245 [Thermomicrobiaceae bacterium CFH 74404]|uniref:Uncharacterized protein n=1 Tax=Thermalbibacter longus TaxID=2951981 RepID=A0AA41WA60_9BACT|nr:hypothetical protein [Thermalbibacter longus]MCM8748346.1 hypothetical protein [Thermalbibacter longus]
MGTQRSEPESQLGRWQQVEGAAHGPRLYQIPALPQRLVQRAGLQALDPRPEAQLDRGHELGVQATEVTGYPHEVGGCSPLGQVVPLHPPGERLLPREPV